MTLFRLGKQLQRLKTYKVCLAIIYRDIFIVGFYFVCSLNPLSV